MGFMGFSEAIARALSPLCGLGAEEIETWLETPPTPELGDYAFP